LFNIAAVQNIYHEDIAAVPEANPDVWIKRHGAAR
jgi:hypothetical protein